MSQKNNRNEITDWLLSGDVSIQYQAQRDVLDTENSQLKKRIATEGWGAKFLQKQNADGHWGRAYYQPKWISTHYTLLDLKNLGIEPNIASVKQILSSITENNKSVDGGILPIGANGQSDVCVNGMFLNFASYFGAGQEGLKSIVDFLLSENVGDGGYNCFSNTKDVVHSSVHSTISVLEGILEYANNGYDYRVVELRDVTSSAEEFLLRHRLYKSDRTGKIISKSMTMLSYPSRWKYDILRALDYFRYAGVSYDERMSGCY